MTNKEIQAMKLIDYMQSRIFASFKNAEYLPDLMKDEKWDYLDCKMMYINRVIKEQFNGSFEEFYNTLFSISYEEMKEYNLHLTA